jgi:SNF2 family DNA or RNA helicase
MEPCVNPETEVQAAGRIHRLGQTKDVEVRKLIYADTHESNMLEFHKEVLAGRITIQADGKVPAAGVKLILRGK